MSALRLASVDTLGSTLATEIGALYREGDINEVSRLITHAALGCGSGAVLSGDCGAGAASALAGEVSAEVYLQGQVKSILERHKSGDLTPDEAANAISALNADTIDVGKLAGGITAALLGGDVDTGTTIAGNAVENNLCGTGTCITIFIITAAWTAYDVYATYKEEGGEAALQQLVDDALITIMTGGAGRLAYKVYKVGGKHFKSASKAYQAAKELFGRSKVIAASKKYIDRIAKRATYKKRLIDDLVAGGTKITPKAVVDIRSINGRTVWLEEGTLKSGLKHILYRHTRDFLGRGITKDQIPDLLFDTLQNGRFVKIVDSGKVYDVDFNGSIQRVLVVVGDNGYIVTGYPYKFK